MRTIGGGGRVGIIHGWPLQTLTEWVRIKD